MIKRTGSIISYERGRRLFQFLFCLFLAFVIWSVHKLSDNYSYYFQYGVLVRGIPGDKQTEFLSENKLNVRVRTSGFYILQYKYGKSEPFIRIHPDSKLFKKIHSQSGVYYILTSEVKDLLNSATGDKVMLENFTTDTLLFKLKK